MLDRNTWNSLIKHKQISFGFFKNVINKLWIYKSYIWYINQQGLICHKIKTNCHTDCLTLILHFLIANIIIYLINKWIVSLWIFFYPFKIAAFGLKMLWTCSINAWINPVSDYQMTNKYHFWTEWDCYNRSTANSENLLSLCMCIYIYIIILFILSTERYLGNRFCYFLRSHKGFWNFL